MAVEKMLVNKIRVKYRCPECGEGHMKVDPIWTALSPMGLYPGDADGVPNICDACGYSESLDRAYPYEYEDEIRLIVTDPTEETEESE